MSAFNRSLSANQPNKRRRMSLGTCPISSYPASQIPWPDEDEIDTDQMGELDKPILDSTPSLCPFACDDYGAMMDTNTRQSQDEWDAAFAPLPEPSLIDAISVESFDTSFDASYQIDDGESCDLTPRTNDDTETEQVQNYDICMDDRTEERNRMMEVLSKAPTQQLRRLSLVSRLEWSLPLTAVARILKRSHLLTSMSLSSVAFEGTKQDFDYFCDCLRFHPSLKEVHMVDCCLVDQSILIDPLLRALAVISTLETVEIYAMDLERDSSVNLMSPSALGALCRSHSITTLSLDDLDLSENHVRELANALKSNDAMTSLTLWDCNLSDKSGVMLAEMLQVNTHLEKMDVSFNELSNGAYTAIADALRVNETLWSLSLHGNCSQLRRKQPGNSRRVSIPQRCTTKSHGYAALVQTLKCHNQVLEELVLDTEEDPRIVLYLTINRNRYLLQDDQVQRRQLVDCLSEYNDPEGRNLSFVYYLLQTNPELCDINR
jgi:hypothetical protein